MNHCWRDFLQEWQQWHNLDEGTNGEAKEGMRDERERRDNLYESKMVNLPNLLISWEVNVN